jgi:acetyl-CoA synthetase
MTKGFLNDPKRYLETYFSRWEDTWYHADWAKIDQDGYWFLYGRSDDTIKVAGKRAGPAEIEEILNKNPSVVESAVIGVPHDVKGEVIVCFVVPRGPILTEKFENVLKEEIATQLGKPFLPEKIRFVKALPKTKSGKIVRGVIKRIFLGLDPGDLSSLEDPQILEEFRKNSR